MNLKWLKISIILISCAFVDMTTALRCYDCESESDAGCKYLQTEEEESAITECSSGISECYTFLSNNSQVWARRGCLDPLTTTCASGGQDSCGKCSSDLCNAMQLALDTCASCDSTTDEHCSVTSELTRTVSCGESTTAKGGCYRSSESWDGPVKRGCVTDLEEDSARECAENGEKCKICSGLNCNLKDTFQRCLSCDSTTDPECLLITPETEFSGVCKAYLDSCAAFVIPNGKTVRGCLQEIDSEPTYCPSTNCVVCDEPDCNNEIVPTHRISCYQCNSTADPACELSQMDNPDIERIATPCATFKYDDQCYKFWDETHGIGYRGCMSDQDQTVDGCRANPIRCSICSNSNCNYDYLTREPSLFCVQCDRTPACMWSFRSATNVCQNRVAFYKTESCYQYLYPNGFMARRGCTLDDDEFCKDNSCKLCTDYFCNGDSYLNQSCIRCTSSGTDAKAKLCEDEAGQIEGETCIVDPIHSERGCYTFRDGYNVVHRGCFFDMEEDWRENCELQYSSRCTRCYGPNCNIYEQGSAAPSSISKTLIAVLVGVAIIRVGF